MNKCFISFATLVPYRKRVHVNISTLFYEIFFSSQKSYKLTTEIPLIVNVGFVFKIAII